MTDMNAYQNSLEEFFNIKPGHQLFEVDVKCRRHLDQITERGINLDQMALRNAELELGEGLMNLQKTIFYASRGVIVKANSAQQVARFLEEEGLSLQRNRTGSPKTGTKDIENFDHPIIPYIVEYRKLLSGHSQVTSVLYKGGERAHPEFDDLTCPTGRIYSKAPNIMGWGERARDAIVADPGYRLIKADYKAQELRILAALSDCKGLKKAFAENIDPHMWVASMMLKKPMSEVTPEERQFGKALNFGTVYMQSAEGLARSLNCSVAEAEQHHRTYNQAYPEIKLWSAEVISSTRKTGVSKTYFGRERRIEMNRAQWFMREKTERQAVNTPVQGTGADLIRKALATIPKNSDKLQVLFPWHDALVIQYREDVKLADVKSYIESVMVVKIGDVTMEIDWSE